MYTRVKREAKEAAYGVKLPPPDSGLSPAEVRAFKAELRRFNGFKLAELLKLYKGQGLVAHLSLVKAEIQRRKVQEELPFSYGLFAEGG